jgi:Fe-S oxidoreductase
MSLTPEEAEEEKGKLLRGEDSRVLKDCVTCYACEEYCPNGNHPFYLIVDRQEEKGIHPVPKPVEKVQVRMMAPTGKASYEEKHSPLMNLCAFTPFEKMSLQGRLFENISTVGGTDVFCNLMYLHFGRSSIIKERVPKTIETLWRCYAEKNQITELICFHDECYGTYTSWAPAYGIEVPFKPVHFFRYVRDELRRRRDEIKRLDMKVAYQRPCSNRLIPETQPLVDEILELIGAERTPRTYDRENALCCGGVMRFQGRDDLADDIQRRNMDDMVATGAQFCVFNCQFCLLTLGEAVAKRGLMPVLLSDLCRLAIGEKPGMPEEEEGIGFAE